MTKKIINFPLNPPHIVASTTCSVHDEIVVVEKNTADFPLPPGIVDNRKSTLGPLYMVTEK